MNEQGVVVRAGGRSNLALGIIVVLCATWVVGVTTVPPTFAGTKKPVATRKATAISTAKATSTTKAAAASAPAATVGSTTGATPVTGSITVFAAASLSASFAEVATVFERANPGANVTLSFAGSSTLVTQIRNGAPADVFASADTANMDKLVAERLIDGEPAVFARNRLMIVVPRGNPARVKSLADLARPEVYVALGSPGVPVGDYARQILAAAGVEVKPRSLESNVSAIVNKAALKEIDAGVVYVTDVAIDDYRVDGVAIPDEQNLVATYPVAALSASRNRAAASAFVAFTRSPAAQSILAKYKFLSKP